MSALASENKTDEQCRGSENMTCRKEWIFWWFCLHLATQTDSWINSQYAWQEHGEEGVH